MKKIGLFPSIILLLGVTLTLLPFFHTGLFDVHDPTSAFRLYTLVETLKAGQFPAAWSNLLNFGYGYPLHLYYAPLFGYLGALVLPLTGSYEISIKVVLAVASIVGGLGAYKVLEKNGRYAGLLGALAFIFLPYRASALYVRGSYAEFLAMSLLPWVIYWWLKPQDTKRTIITTAIVTSLCILAHNTLPLLVAPIILLMVALFQKKNLRGSLLTLLAVFGLTSWFILPVFFERSLIQVEAIAGRTNFRDHFLQLSQLWYSPWGYGGSAKGVAEDHMSFMLGKGQLLLAILGVAALIKQKKWRVLGLLSAIVASFAFLTLPQSQFIWETLPILSVMQFPWRSLAVVGVGIALLSGSSLGLVPGKLQGLAFAVIALLLIYTNYSYFRPQEYRNYNQDIVSSQNNLDPLVRDKIPEYLPTAMPNFPGSRRGDDLTRTATTVYGTITLPDNSPLIINTAYMPQWHLTINGSESTIVPSAEGLVTASGDVHSGTTVVSLTWHATTLETVSLLVSVATTLAVIGLLVL